MTCWPCKGLARIEGMCKFNQHIFVILTLQFISSCHISIKQTPRDSCQKALLEAEGEPENWIPGDMFIFKYLFVTYCGCRKWSKLVEVSCSWQGSTVALTINLLESVALYHSLLIDKYEGDSDCSGTQTHNHLHLLNEWMFIFELSGCGSESCCSRLNFRFCTCFKQGVPWHSGNYTV